MRKLIFIIKILIHLTTLTSSLDYLSLINTQNYHETLESRHCLPGQFMCHYSHECIPMGWLCDGENDCGLVQSIDSASQDKFKSNTSGANVVINQIDTSDEDLHCNQTNVCPKNYFRCANLITCIPFEQLCNNVSNCPDGSDELEFCSNYQACDELNCDFKCKPIPKGAECYCEDGSEFNGTSCIPINQCRFEEQCEQICLNEKDSFKCSCVAGYQLVKETKCQAINDPIDFPLLLAFNNNDNIIFLYKNGSFKSKIELNQNQLQKFLTFDIDFDNDTFCYTTTAETIDKNIWNISLLNHNYKSSLNRIFCTTLKNHTFSSWSYSIKSPFYSTLFARQIIFEWIAKNWYILDPVHEYIFVCNRTFSVCATIVDSGLNKPKMFALDSIEGYLFYIERGPSALLGRFFLDGSNKTILVKERIVNPNGLSLDMANRKVYWFDSYVETLERIDYNGLNRRQILKNYPDYRIIDFNIFEHKIYFLSQYIKQDFNKTFVSLFELDIFNGHDLKTIPVSNAVNMSFAQNLHIVHRQRQPTIPENVHPCSHNNGGCDHICITLYEENSNPNHRTPIARCLCSSEFTLNSKTGKCSINNNLPALIYIRGRPSSIKLISFNSDSNIFNGTEVSHQTANQIMIPTAPLTRPVAVDYDLQSKTIFYSDIQRYVINYQQFDTKLAENSTNIYASVFIDRGVIQCEGIAIDWLGRNLYWTDSALLAISVAKITNSTIRKHLITTNLNHPKSIALDPLNGLMYWTDWTFNSNISGKIERSWMDGNERQILITDRLNYPNGLTIDFTGGHIYWCDAYSKQLERADLDGKNRKLIIDGQHLGYPYSVAYYRNFLFWTEYREGVIKSLNLLNNEIRTILKDNSPLFDLKFIDNQIKLNVSTNCEYKKCQHLCLLTPTKSMCYCSEGYVIRDDLITCEVQSNYTRPSLCKKGEFECRKTSQCIDNRLVCDGEVDCIDGSDEDTLPGSICEQLKCKEGYFRCDKNRCILPHQVCDGDKDCLDGTDENQFDNCSNITCSSSYFKCEISGHCIPESWICDSHYDCGPGDFSDERQNCSYPRCDETQFRCNNNRCISLVYLCDGYNDCKDKSDEENCPQQSKMKCNNKTQFACDKFKCLPLFLKCNGVIDCVDGTDEEGCQNSKFLNKTVICPKNDSFMCLSGQCIPQIWRCDGKVDCLDSSDEFKCSKTSCTADYFFCAELSKCLNSTTVRCDGHLDCPDGSDEEGCNNTAINEKHNDLKIDQITNCKHPNRTCSDQKTNETICLDISRFCDNRSDCAEDADEGGLCNLDRCFFSDCKGLCHNVPYDLGYVCYCSPGLYLSIDGVSCTDAHPCDQWGICSQRCTPTKHSYRCHCIEEYELDPLDNFTCKSVMKSSPIVIFSNRHEIRSINLRTNSNNLLLHGLKNTIALDYLFSESEVHVFWTDVLDDKIYRGQLIQHTITNIEAVVENGLTAAEGLAVDWIARNLYWVESNLDQIEVSRIDGTYRKTLITENLTSPRAISLDPIEKIMFWSDWDSESPRIEAASMDGTRRRIVTTVSPGSWPNGIALDFVLKRVYWIDAKIDALSTIKYNGEDFRNVLLSNQYLTHPFAVNLYENFVYWSDWRTNSLVRANKWNGTNVEVIARTFSQPFDVKVIHPSRQPTSINGSQCSVNNGGCSHLCLLSENALGYSCHCPHTMRLNVDNKTCVLNEVFLLISKQSDVRGIDLDQPNYLTLPPISMPKVLNPIQLDYVSSNKHIYWADSQLNEIKRFSLVSGKIETVIDTVIQQPQTFAIDWVSKNIFIVSKHVNDLNTATVFDEIEEIEYDEDDSEGGSSSSHHQSHSETHTKQASLFICNLNGEYISQIDSLSNFTNPLSLTLDPFKGYIYWSEHIIINEVKELSIEPNTMEDSKNISFNQNKTIVKVHHSFIIRSRMDGTNQQILSDSHDNHDLNQATSLQLDGYLNYSRIYWVNLGSNSIQYIQLDDIVPTLHTLYPENGFLNLEPSSLTIFGSKLFVAFHLEGSIRTMDKTSGKNVIIFSNRTDDILDIRVFDANLQKGHNLCSINKGNCSHLCVMVSETRRKCLCTMGFWIDSNNETNCIGKDVFLMYSWNWGIRAVSTNNTVQKSLPLIKQFEMKKSLNKENSLIPPISKILMASSIDFNSEQQILYWTDSDEGSISSVHRDTSHYSILVSGVEKLVDFAFDWISSNLYWMDENFGLIEVMRINHTSRLVIVSEDIIKPTSIAIHPGLGFMFWSDIGHPNSVQIESAYLNGFNRSVIYKTDKQHTINNLAVDFQHDYLYFSDSSEQNLLRLKINAQNSENLQTVQVILTKVRSPISISLDQNYFYWADTSYFGGAIFSINKDHFYTENFTAIIMSANLTEVTLIEFNIGDHVKDIVVYRDRPFYSNNTCKQNNGGCEDFCFYLGPKLGHHCACTYGYISQVDQRSCLEYDIFLMFSRINQIDSVHVLDHSSINNVEKESRSNLVNSPYRPIIHSNIRNVIGLAQDYSRRRVIYSDVQKGTINWCYFNGTDHQVLLDKQGPIEGLVFDQKNRFLYWTSNTDYSISKVNLTDVPENSNHNSDSAILSSTQIIKIVKLKPDDRLRGIAIDSCRFRVYWTNWNTKRPSIQRSDINGLNVRSIVTKNIRMPNSIVLDQHQLYWSDARLNKIERCDLEGLRCVVLLSKTPQHPFGLAIYQEYLFWTDWAAHALYRCNKHTGDDVVSLRRNIPRPMGIVVVAPTLPPPDDCLANYNPCSIINGGCEDICNIKNDTAFDVAECSCFEGRVLASDGRHCSFINSNCSEEEGKFECSKIGNCIPFELTCDGIDNCLDGKDEDSEYCATRVCPSSYHQCSDNRCITRTKVCDGIVHCGDASDEKDCDCNEQGKFKCNNGICISDILRCNYEPECPDGFDELNCPKPNCSLKAKDNELLINCLTTTACISPNWICDGQNDCWDNSDEVNCHELYNKTTFHSMKYSTITNANETSNGTSTNNSSLFDACMDDQFRCGSNECIAIVWSCDGNKDCIDGSDESEEFCINRNCPVDYFKCNSTGQCIPQKWVCDGERDCSDGSDEQYKVLGQNQTELCSIKSTGRVCKHNEFQCKNFQCVNLKFFCDGVDDCGDGSDESDDDCRHQTDTSISSQTCSPTQYRCKNYHKCIPRSWICNGIQDCAGGDDESNQLCTKNNPTKNEQNSTSIHCEDNQFVCGNGVCLNANLICNGNNDCGDFSDENQCNVNECETKLVCAQMCEDMPVGYRCSCYEGFEPQDGGRVCKDINECDKRTCSQLCRNTYGSYVCSCVEGYELDKDGFTCRATAPIEAKLVLTSQDGIHIVKPIEQHQTGKDVRLLLGNLNNAVALDFDWSENCIYWSEITEINAFIKRFCGSLNSLSLASKSNSANSNNLDQDIQILHSNTLQSPDGIAVDWIGRNLYWCDKGKSTIEVSNLDGKFRRVLIRNNLEEPRAIVVNPLEGIMFWSDWGERPYIGRASMDGSNDRIILEESLGWPNALSIDFIRRELYFADAREDYIGVADFNGKNRAIIFNGKTRFTSHIFALAYFESRLYWSDWHSNAVVSCPIHNCTYQNFVPQISVHRPMDIQILHPTLQAHLPKGVKHPCNSQQSCLALCLLREKHQLPSNQNDSHLSGVCTCPENYILNDDNISCQSNCSYSQFVCNTTYKCIPFWWKCDTQDDCGDGSDEPETCPPFNCNPGQFQCQKDHECLLPTQICDGVRNCADGSDELDCDRHVCMPNQFKCESYQNTSAYCIAKSMRCDGNNDCLGGEDEMDCDCPKAAFKCSNNKCISSEWECDGEDDCGDGSDEPESCSQRNCSSNYFRCNSGRCIQQNWKCDHEPDCPGHEDELTCDYANSTYCDENYFHCNNNQCIKLFYKCDMDDDCGDGSDELNCTFSQCSLNEFRCDNDLKCISNELRCNGEFNCLDMSDERDCHYQCQENEFQCINDTLCILNQWKCDGDFDCIDGSDEHNCSNSCLAKDFTCANKQCIYGSWRCDGDRDCLDGSDEDYELCSKLSCPVNRFRCSNGICISKQRLCDGVDNCGDSSDEDELVCQNLKRECLTGLSIQHANRFVCLNKHCIDISLRCNGNDDCGDGSDETNCYRLWNATYHSNNCPFGLCSQGCIVKKIHHDQNTSTTMKNHTSNLNFMCQCSDGYSRIYLLNGSTSTPVSDGSRIQQLATCQANGKQATLLISSDSGFRVVNPYKNSIQELFKIFPSYTNDTLNITLPLNRTFISRIESFDVLTHENLTSIFWTNPHKRSLFRMDISFLYNLIDLKRDSNLKTISSTKAKISEPIPIISNLENPRGVSIDWVSEYVYCVEASTPSIMLFTFDGKRRKTILSSHPLEQPYDLVVDPKNGYLFWTDWSHTSIKIGRATLDGSSWLNLVKNDVEWPLGLTLDYEADRLYWCDPKTSSIETVRIDGTDRHRVYSLNRFHHKPYRLEVWEDFLFVTTIPNHQVLRLDKFGNNKVLSLVQGIAKLTDLVIVHESKQNKNISNPCKQLPCHPSFICIARNPQTSVCVCPDGFKKVLTVQNEVECVNISENTFDETRPYEEKCPCLNGGRCRYSDDDSLLCECTPLYDGKLCENFRCSGHCQNHGLCYIDLSNVSSVYPSRSASNNNSSLINWNGKPRCMCLFGWKGDRCEIPLSSCEYPDVCFNGGKCINNIQNKSIQCNCNEDFHGEECEFCSKLPCRNGGFCSKTTSGQFQCNCLTGFGGKYCELHVCSKEYCNNNGHCYIEQNLEDISALQNFANFTKFKCSCFPGYTGSRCETDIAGESGQNWTSTCGDFHCLNGGACHQATSFDKPTCICLPGYVGIQCEVPADSVKIQNQNKGNDDNLEAHHNLIVYVSLAVIGVVFLALILFRLHDTLCKKMQSDLAFQHHRIENNGTVDVTNIEIMNPIFNLNANEEENDKEFIVDYMNTNFSNPIYDYKKLVNPDQEETENLLDKS